MLKAYGIPQELICFQDFKKFVESFIGHGRALLLNKIDGNYDQILGGF